MALTDLRTSIGSPTTYTGFNNLIASYPELANKLVAVYDDTAYQLFTYNGISFTSQVRFGGNVTYYCCIDTDNKIFLLKGSYNYSLPYLICFYGDSDFIINLGDYNKDCVYGTTKEDLSISTVSTPTISANTFSGYYWYSENRVFKNVIRYITTPSTVEDTNIQTPTKDILIVCGGSNSVTQGCTCIALDL